MMEVEIGVEERRRKGGGTVVDIAPHQLNHRNVLQGQTCQPGCMCRRDPYNHFPFLGRWEFHFLRGEGKGTVFPQGDYMDGGTHAGRQYEKGPDLKRHFQMRGAGY